MEDCIIIGAGAAGLFAAGAAVHAGKRVTVLEHMDAPGKKLLITGKGRCNVTNNCGPDEFLKNVRRNPRFLYSALNACPPAFVMELLKAFPVELAGKGDLAHAVVTSGGVSVKEVDPKTMQSKLCPGLYFAGEVLDVDAYTGGYNLGIAFATAYAAASHL